jgi:hypothetical protein
MTDHYFRVGQLVTLDPGDPSAPGDGRTYKILQLLPEAWGVKHYRIKSIAEPAHRIVPENLLSDDTCVSRDRWKPSAPRRLSCTPIVAHFSSER